LALYAFNIELARIRDLVSEPAMGEIRLRWWLDVIDGIYRGDTAAHPVVQSLALAIERGNLPKVALAQMVEARRFDLYNDPMPTLNDLEGYLGETSAALIQLSALVLNKERAKGSAEAAGLAGVAAGVAGLLRGLPLQRARGQCYVPLDLLAQHGLTSADLIAGRPEDRLQELLGSLCEFGRERLRQVRSLAIDRGIFPAFLPACLTELYINQAKKLGALGLDHTADISQLRRQWRLYWCAKRGAL
jgi:15-cis-phytoene synthase